MPDLKLDLPDALVERLRVRAARSGRSVEDEAAFLLDAALGSSPPGTPEAVQGFVRDLYGGEVPEGVVDDLIARRRAEVAAKRQGD